MIFTQPHKCINFFLPQINCVVTLSQKISHMGKMSNVSNVRWQHSWNVVGNTITDLMHKSFLIITEKRMTKFASYFAQLWQKKLQLKPPKATIFRYNNTELTCKQIHKNCSLIFVSRNPGNILVKSVSFYLERFQSYGVLKKVQLFGPPCTLHTNPRQLLLQCNERATCRPRTRAAV